MMFRDPGVQGKLSRPGGCALAEPRLLPLPSDQTDPFNRSPLTMDQVRPNTELKERIQRWLAERKSAKERMGDIL